MEAPQGQAGGRTNGTPNPSPPPVPPAYPDTPVTIPDDITDEMSVKLLASDQLVRFTACLPWTMAPAAPPEPATASLPTYVMAIFFLPRCSLSPDTETMELLRRLSALEFALTGATWRRILNAYVAAGLLAATCPSRRDLKKRIRALIAHDPEDLLIKADDFAPVESVDVPPQPARPAQGRPGQRGHRAAVPAVPAQPGPAALQIIHRCSIWQLMDPDNSVEPLAPLATVLGCLGPCSTRNARAGADSPAQRAADVLRLAYCAWSGAYAPNDSAAAGSLR